MTYMQSPGEDPLDILKRQRAASQAPAPGGGRSGGPEGGLDPLDELMRIKAAARQTIPPREPGADKFGPGLSHGTSGEWSDKTPPTLAHQAWPYQAATHYLNMAQGLPGAEAFEAAAGALGSHFIGDQPLTYQQSLSTLRGQTSQIGGKLRALEQMVGGAPAAAVTGGMSGAKAAAMLGAASGALNADDPLTTGKGWVSRIAKTGAGGLVGGMIGGATDRAGAALRSTVAPRPEINVAGRMESRAEAAKHLFLAAEGQFGHNGATPELRAFLQEPEMASRIEALQKLEQFKNVDPYSFAMVDALHKKLADESKQIAKGLSQADPARPNTGRFLGQSVDALKKKLMALSVSPGEKPPLFDTVPAATHSVEPVYTAAPARDVLEGPMVPRTPPAPSVRAEMSRRTEGTPAQQLARDALERHGSEGGAVAQDYTGRTGANSPQGGVPGWRSPATVPRLISPGVEVSTPAMRVQTAPAEVANAPMPAYLDAKRDYAQQSQGIRGVTTGMTALQKVGSPRRATAADIMSKAPKTEPAFAEWAKHASPSEQQAAREGILGDLRNAFSEPQGKTWAPYRRTAGAAADLLRVLDPNDRGVKAARYAGTSGTEGFLAALSSYFGGR